MFKIKYIAAEKERIKEPQGICRALLLILSILK